MAGKATTEIAVTIRPPHKAVIDERRRCFSSSPFRQQWWWVPRQHRHLLGGVQTVQCAGIPSPRNPSEDLSAAAAKCLIKWHESWEDGDARA